MVFNKIKNSVADESTFHVS